MVAVSNLVSFGQKCILDQNITGNCGGCKQLNVLFDVIL